MVLFLIYEFSLRRNCLWQSKTRRYEKKTHKVRWKVNSYVLETSGVLIFSSHSVSRQLSVVLLPFLRTRCNNIGLEKMIYECTGEMGWMRGKWEKLRFEGILAGFMGFLRGGFSGVKSKQ